jgi:multicomponent Na+:H+ antiporter subunit B
MDLKKSNILRISLRKLFPFIIVFAFYMFTYGANFPGGGFQAGVIFGTIIIIYDIIFTKEKESKYFYKLVEYAGLAIIIFLLLFGFAVTGNYFGYFYHLQFNNIIFSNFLMWIFNTAIFLEVAGSIVLIFRYFIDITA